MDVCLCSDICLLLVHIHMMDVCLCSDIMFAACLYIYDGCVFV